MDKKFSFMEKLDFKDIDLTAPDKVIEKILQQLPKETNNIIMGKIQPYSGKVLSYKVHDFPTITQVLAESANKTVDIQKDLGALYQETHKFECFLYTPEYDKYKYRVFFMKYDIANYPVDVILDDTVSQSISVSNSGYIYKCNNREELENLVYNILNSKRLVTVMQKLIRINQAKKHEKNDVDTDSFDEVE